MNENHQMNENLSMNENEEQMRGAAEGLLAVR